MKVPWYLSHRVVLTTKYIDVCEVLGTVPGSLEVLTSVMIQLP